MAFSVSLKSEPAARLLDYWDRLRGDRLMPQRSGLDPAELKAILPYLTILEVRARDTLIYRLAGTAIRDMVGTELTNRNLLDFTPSTSRAVRSWRHWTIATLPCGAFYHLPLTYSGGAVNMHEGLLLPMAPDRAGSPPLLLGVLTPIQGNHWLNQNAAPLFDIAPDINFVDIGAGIPDRKDPPEDYRLTD